MSHETSLHTSRTVLMASIAICSCLALASVFRLSADRRNPTESAHGSTRIAATSLDRNRSCGEFYPRNVNNGELLEERLRVHERLDALSAQSVRESTSHSATPVISDHAVATAEIVSPVELSQLQVQETHSIVVPSPAANIVETEEPISDFDDDLVNMTPISAPPIEMAEPEALSPLDTVVSEVFPLPLPIPSAISPERMALPELISDEPSDPESRNQTPILDETEIVLFPESIEQPNTVENSLSTLTGPEPSAPSPAFSEPALPGPVLPATVLTGPTSAIPPSMDSDLSVSVAASDFMTEDKFTFPDTSARTVNEQAANAVSATMTQERSYFPAVPPAIESEWSDHTLTQSNASKAFVESSATSDRRSVANQESAGRASSGTANHSHRTVSPLTRMRERMAGFLKAPSRPGFDRPDWVDDLGDWRERQSESLSSAARSVTSPSKTTPRNPDAHQGRTDSRSRQGFTQPESSGRTFAASFRNADPPEWIGSVRNAAAQRSAKGSQMLHRAASAVRYAAQPKTVE